MSVQCHAYTINRVVFISFEWVLLLIGFTYNIWKIGVRSNMVHLLSCLEILLSMWDPMHNRRFLTSKSLDFRIHMYAISCYCQKHLPINFMSPHMISQPYRGSQIFSFLIYLILFSRITEFHFYQCNS